MFFDRKNHESFLRIKRKAIDPYRAYEKAKELLEDNMAVYRLYDHEYQYKIGLAPYGVLIIIWSLAARMAKNKSFPVSRMFTGVIMVPPPSGWPVVRH